MNYKIPFLTGFALFAFVSCTSNSTDPLPEEEVVNDPVAANLIFPQDQTECNEGTILSDTQSEVVFKWSASENTDSYEVIVKNNDTETSSTITAATNSKEITLERGTNYEWQVISRSETSQSTAASAVFQFFNAAPGVTSHVPFSAEAIAPEDSSEISVASGKVILQWQASDIDNDIRDYEIFFGTDKDQLASIGVFTTNTLEANVVSGTTYFWRVKTNDETNNTSESDIFSFSVQ